MFCYGQNRKKYLALQYFEWNDKFADLPYNFLRFNFISQKQSKLLFLSLASGADFAFIVWPLALSPLDKHIKMPSAQLASSLCANNVCSPAAEVGSGSCINKNFPPC